MQYFQMRMHSFVSERILKLEHYSVSLRVIGGKKAADKIVQFKEIKCERKIISSIFFPVLLSAFHEFIIQPSNYA